MHLLVHPGIGRVHHVEQDIRVLCLLQGTLKSLDEVVWQLADKAHCVCQEHLLAPRQLQIPGGRVQRGKELVLGQDAGSGEVI